MRQVWIAAALAAIVLSVAPGESYAQGVPCDEGRGGLMTDLGFDRLPRSMRTDPRSGRMEPIFEAEPRITGVRPQGPAGGLLREGDVLVAVDGSPITTPEGARRHAEIRPGEEVRFSVRRDGRVRDVTITATGRCIPHPPVPEEAPAPPDAPAAPAPPVPPDPPAHELMPQGWFGFMIQCQECGRDESTGVFRFHRPPVVVSVEPNSPAMRAGLRSGDRLTHLDGIPLTSDAGWARFYAIQPGETVRLTFDRNGESHSATVTALPRPLDSRP